MQEILDSLLTPLITEERKEVLLDCVASFEEMDYSVALDELHMVCEIQDGLSDNAMLLGRLDDIIHIAHHTLFREHQIQVDPEATQAQCQAIVRTLTSLEHYILPDQIAQVLDGGFDNEAIFAHLVPLVSEFVFEDIEPLILFVSDPLIEAISSLIRERMRLYGLADYAVPDVSKIRYINQCLQRVGKDRMSLIVELSNSGVRAGRPLPELMGLSLDALDRLNPVEAAFQLLGLVVFSDTPVEQTKSTVIDLIEDYTENLLEQRLMENELLGVLKQLEA
jgi:hypothetical protein